MNKVYITKIWIDNGVLYALTDKGATASYDLRKFRSFRNATDAQILNYKMMGNGSIRWPELDEDINLEGMLHDNHLCPLTKTEDSVEYRPQQQRIRL